MRAIMWACLPIAALAVQCLAQDADRFVSAKTTEAGSPAEVSGVVSVALPELPGGYVQDPVGGRGIAVTGKALPAPGTRVTVRGAAAVLPGSDEVCVAASEVQEEGAGDLSYSFVDSLALGGRDEGRQRGVPGAWGRNRVGMLVRMQGMVSAIADDGSAFRLTDGVSKRIPDSDGSVLVDLEWVPRGERPALAVGQVAVVAGISRVLLGPNGQRLPALFPSGAADIAPIPSNSEDAKTMRVLVVSFDPVCPEFGGQHQRELLHENDPHDLADQYISILAASSGGYVRYEITQWIDADYNPAREDGFTYPGDEIVRLARSQDPNRKYHPGNADYPRLLTDRAYAHNQRATIAERIARDEFDEVFFFGDHNAFGGWEASMAGPSPFFINGGVYTIPDAKRNFVVMWFNPERGVDCMLENLVHRAECTLSRAFGAPDMWFSKLPLANDWDRFRMIEKVESGGSAVGMCHFAPNSTGDYQWGNPAFVQSTCDDWWLNWPRLQGEATRRRVNGEEWGAGDQRLHHQWWLCHLPKAPGVGGDGLPLNWWKLLCDFATYPGKAQEEKGAA